MIRENTPPVTEHALCACAATDATSSRPASPNELRAGGWHTRTTLFASPTITIGATRCRPQTEAPGPECQAGSTIMAFPRRGVFVLHMASESFIADPNQVLLHNPSDIFRCSHPGLVGDDTTWFGLSNQLVIDAIAAIDPSVHDHPDRPFRLSHLASEPATYLMHRLAFEHASRAGADPVYLQELTLDLLSRVVASTYREIGARPKHQPRPDTLRAHRECAEAVKQMLAVRYREHLTLDEIAAEVHVAPCHLCRLFRRYTGLPIHRYLNRLRLRAAVNRFVDPAANLAGVATDMGFASHSHFSDAFRKEFLLTPSAVRDGLLSRRDLRQWSANWIA